MPVARRFDREEELAGVTPADRAFLEALFGHEDIGVGILDGELCYLRVNAALAAMHGQSPEEHTGRRPGEILPGGLGAGLERRFRRVLTSGEPVVGVEVSGSTPAQ